MASTFVTRGPAITIFDDHLSFTLKKTTRCCVSIERFQSLLGTIGGVRLFQILVLKNAKSNSYSVETWSSTLSIYRYRQHFMKSETDSILGTEREKLYPF